MATEKCKKCGALLTEKSKFCPECGAPIVQIMQDEESEKMTVNEPFSETTTGVKPEIKETAYNMAPVIIENSEKAEQSEDEPEKSGDDQYQDKNTQNRNSFKQNAQYPGVKEQFNPYITPPPSDSKYAVAGMWSFVGMIILFSLPIIGFILAIVWACDNNNVNRSNYARAVLIITAISLLLGIAIIVVGFVLYYNVIVQIFQTFEDKSYIFPFNDNNIQINKFINSVKFNNGAAILQLFNYVVM